jgi:hypothetical protein
MFVEGPNILAIATLWPELEVTKNSKKRDEWQLLMLP